MKSRLFFLSLVLLGLRSFTQTNPTKIDYFPLFIGGLSTEQIIEGSKSRNLEVNLISEDKAFVKYMASSFWETARNSKATPWDDYKKHGFSEGLTHNQFHNLYITVKDSYDKFQANKNNGNLAPLWYYDKPGTGKIDLNEISNNRLPPGYDEYGRQIASPQEVAKKRAEYEAEQKNPPKEDYSLLCKCRYHSYWYSNQTICDNEEKKFGLQVKTIWETICPQTYSLNINSFGGLNKKDMIIKYDKDGLPFWQVVYTPK